MSELYTEVQRLKESYPDWHSAMLPALRLAQERHGYLSPEALRARSGDGFTFPVAMFDHTQGQAVTGLEWAMRGSQNYPPSMKPVIFAPGAANRGFACFATERRCTLKAASVALRRRAGESGSKGVL